MLVSCHIESCKYCNDSWCTRDKITIEEIFQISGFSPICTDYEEKEIINE